MILTQANGAWTAVSGPLPPQFGAPMRKAALTARGRESRVAAVAQASSATSSSSSSLAGVGCGTDDFCAAVGGVNAGGLLETTKISGLPLVMHVAPASGAYVGGTWVTVTGTNFTPQTSVLFGNTPARSTYINARAIRAVAPCRQTRTHQHQCRGGRSPLQVKSRQQFHLHPDADHHPTVVGGGGGRYALRTEPSRHRGLEPVSVVCVVRLAARRAHLKGRGRSSERRRAPGRSGSSWRSPTTRRRVTYKRPGPGPSRSPSSVERGNGSVLARWARVPLCPRVVLPGPGDRVGPDAQRAASPRRNRGVRPIA